MIDLVAMTKGILVTALRLLFGKLKNRCQNLLTLSSIFYVNEIWETQGSGFPLVLRLVDGFDYSFCRGKGANRKHSCFVEYSRRCTKRKENLMHKVIKERIKHENSHKFCHGIFLSANTRESLLRSRNVHKITLLVHWIVVFLNVLSFTFMKFVSWPYFQIYVDERKYVSLLYGRVCYLYFLEEYVTDMNLLFRKMFW